MSTETIDEIRAEVARAGKRIVRSGLYRHLNALGIAPLGTRQRPQRYPAGSGRAVIERLGLATNGAGHILSLAEIKRQANGGAKTRGRR
jgi:hypothetical protein